MSNEDQKNSGKSRKISGSDKLRLATISLVHHRFGSRPGTELPISRRRLLHLLYLADLEYHRLFGQTYLGVAWIYANNGPFVQGFGHSISSMEGLELERSNQQLEDSIEYTKGRFNRFTTWKLDSKFEAILLEIKQQCYFMSLGQVGNRVYATKPMTQASMGDYLF